MNIKQKQTIEAYNHSAKDFMKKIGTLDNYNTAYNYLIEKINENSNVLDLACGPGQISKYIQDRKKVNVTGVDLSKEMLKIARKNIPRGTFIEDSIITFKTNFLYDVIINGFGIPYLNQEETEQCLRNSVLMLKPGGYIYVSFMEGNSEGFEKTSFGGDNVFYMYYHEKRRIKNVLKINKIETEKEYAIDYQEPDGRITKDIVIIGRKT